jgi:hypothetical protein
MNPNSVVLLCAADDIDRVNGEVAALLGNAADARNLSREISADGATVTHFGGHGWFDDLQCKELSQIDGLTVQAAVLDGKPQDNWLVALKSVNSATVLRDEADSKVLIIEAKREPEDAARITAARAAFDAKAEAVR